MAKEIVGYVKLQIKGGQAIQHLLLAQHWVKEELTLWNFVKHLMKKLNHLWVNLFQL